MTTKKLHWVLTIFLIMVVCANLLNVRSVRADGETPTEPPAPTEVQTEPSTEPSTEPPVESTPDPVESTPEPVESTPAPVEAEATPIAEVLTQVPESTEVVILDEEGNSVPLATQDAAEIVEGTDPMWCPEGVLPGGTGCTSNFPSVSQLITDIMTNTATYTQNGIIYFTANPGIGAVDLSASNLGGGVFDAINDFDLTFQGGWNESTVSPSFSGQTNFGSIPFTIGSSSNPWAGSITLIDIRFSGVSSNNNAITVYTDAGDITLDNVDVQSQSGGGRVALLDTNSGDILVQNGSTFQSANVTNRGNGFSANSDTGSITISGDNGNNITFNNFRAPGAPIYNGATLSAPTVSLSYVSASGNDGNGFAISQASLVTLNNVTSGPDVDTQGNSRSGVLINGTGSTIVQVIGGTFADNGRYGIELYGGTLYIQTSPVCPLSGSTINTLGCYNVTSITDSTPPVITPNVSGTIGSNGWYTSDVTVSWSAIDAESDILSLNGCTASNLTSDTASTTLTCSATNKAGVLDSVSITIKIDKTAPTLSLPSNITAQATQPTGAIVNYPASATDNLDASASANCSPASGSVFVLGTTTVSCSATDAAGNTVSGSFQVTVANAPSSPATGPTNTSGSTPGSSAPVPSTSASSTLGSSTSQSEPSTLGSSTSESESSTLGSSTSQSNPAALIIPLTGGEAIDLNCNTAFWAFGIKLSFMNLCDHQTIPNSINVNNLPGNLPDGYSFVMGLDLKISSKNQAIENLPNGTAIQMDFPISGGSKDKFAVLYWNGDEWVEISQQINSDEISQTVNGNTDEFYQIQAGLDGFYQIITTAKTGIFVLVKK